MRSVHALLLSFVMATPLLGAAHEVVPGIHLIRGAFVPGSQPDGNSVILEAPDGLIVVDSGRHAEHTQAILDFAKAASLPIKAVVNSHWHLDHIGGNAMLRDAYPGLKIYASDALAGATKGFLANYHKQLEEMIASTADPAGKKTFQSELAIIDSAPRLAPDVVIAASGPQTIAGRPLRVGLERYSVTAGDVWLYDANSGVLIAGDLVTLPAPFLDTACPAQWKASLDTLAGTDFTLLIPGHGPPLTRKQFDVYRTAFTHLLGCAGGTATKQACIDGWMNDIGPLVPKKDAAFTRMLMDYYVDVLKRSPADVAKLCGK
jgi:glyoxylase-like metal-dependent hydrolase (beta-lactamase superfamily II)